MFHDSDAQHHNIWSPNALAKGNKDEQGQCIWYGTCSDCDYAYNYAYSGEAMPLAATDHDALYSVCPELFDQFGKLNPSPSDVPLNSNWNFVTRPWRRTALLLRFEANRRFDCQLWTGPQFSGTMPKLRPQFTNDLLFHDVRSPSQ